MKLISTPYIGVWKRFMPGAFVVTGIGVTVLAVTSADSQEIMAVGVLFILGGVFTWLSMRRVADDVWDDQYALQVRRGKVEDQVLIREVELLEYAIYFSPHHITLKLSRPTLLGDKIVFVPHGAPWTQRRVAEELRDRIRLARAA